MQNFRLSSRRGRAAGFLFLLVTFAGSGGLYAQAVSNLGEGTSGSVFSVGNSSSVRTLLFGFTTGATASSFDFSSVEINFANAVGSPSGGVTANLFSSSGIGILQGLTSTTSSDATALSNLSGATPLASLTLVGGTQPTTSGLYTYSGSATLLASTTYYLQLSASGQSSGNAFQVREAASPNETAGLAGWTIGNASFVNENGSWIVSSGPTYGAGDAPSFSVQASAIPEPSTYAAIIGAAMLGLAGWKRRRLSPVAK